MDSISVAEGRTERMIRAFMEGVEAELLEIRGRGLTVTERVEYEAEAVAIYSEMTMEEVIR